MTVSVTFSVVQLGEFPAIRSQGREGRDRLDDLVARRQSLDLTIDFSGVEAMSFSFVDEFLGKFLTSDDLASSDVTVKLAGLDDDNLYAVLVCVERRGTQVAVLRDGTLSLLGDDMLAATFERAVELGTFSAKEMGEALSLSSPNANNRLKRLTAVGALRKTHVTGSQRGGKEFVYQAPSVEVPDGQSLTPA